MFLPCDVFLCFSLVVCLLSRVLGVPPAKFLVFLPCVILFLPWVVCFFSLEVSVFSDDVFVFSHSVFVFFQGCRCSLSFALVSLVFALFSPFGLRCFLCLVCVFFFVWCGLCLSLVIFVSPLLSWCFALDVFVFYPVLSFVSSLSLVSTVLSSFCPCSPLLSFTCLALVLMCVLSRVVFVFSIVVLVFSRGDSLFPPAPRAVCLCCPVLSLCFVSCVPWFVQCFLWFVPLLSPFVSLCSRFLWALPWVFYVFSLVICVVSHRVHNCFLCLLGCMDARMSGCMAARLKNSTILSRRDEGTSSEQAITSKTRVSTSMPMQVSCVRLSVVVFGFSLVLTVPSNIVPAFSPTDSVCLSMIHSTISNSFHIVLP